MKSKKKITSLKKKISNIIHFLTLGIWRVKVKSRPKHEFFLITVLRIIILSLKEFNKDLCQLRASALTFYTLISIVPVLALAFGIARGFNVDDTLKKQILNAFDAKAVIATNIVSGYNVVTNYVTIARKKKPKMLITYNYALVTNSYEKVVPENASQEDISDDKFFGAQFVIIEKAFEFTNRALQNVSGGIITGIGIVLLFWSVIKVLGQVEHSFNAIWGVTKSRHIGRKFTDYLSVMILAPILLAMSNSINVLIKSRLNIVFDQFHFLSIFEPALKLISYLFIWFLFAFTYIFMPNTKVKLSSGIIAGIVAGTIFNLVQWFYISFQIGMSKYNAIYGSFAALPLFLIWLQISWIIVLYGSELAFAYQNVDTYEFEPESMNISHSYKRLLILFTAHTIIKRFINAEKPMSDAELSKSLDIPVRLMRQILDRLVEADIICKVVHNDDENFSYNPAIDVDKLTVGFIVKAIDNHGDDTFPVNETPAFHKLSQIIDDFQKLIQNSPENLKLADI